jgi:hypothetical protein
MQDAELAEGPLHWDTQYRTPGEHALIENVFLL